MNSLSKREKQVLKFILNEQSSQEIADLLSLKLSTIETHRRNMFKKLGVKNVIGLAKYAIGEGLV